MKDAIKYINDLKVENASLRQAIAQAEKHVSYSGNGTAGRENTTAPTGFFFQMPKAEQEQRCYCGDIYRLGVIHITTWEKDARGRDAIRIYKLGAGKDAKRHTMTQRERAARYRTKKAGLAFINRVSMGGEVRA